MHYQSVAYFGALSFGDFTFLFGLRIGCFFLGVLATSGKSSNSLRSFSFFFELVAAERLVLMIGVLIG